MSHVISFLVTLVLVFGIAYYHKHYYNRPPKPIPPVEVGAAMITINDTFERQFQVIVLGKAIFSMYEDRIIIADAEDEFEYWRRRTGEMGTVAVGNDMYVPLCNIKDINVRYETRKIVPERSRY